MRSSLAEVVVDLAVSAADEAFHYRVPASLEGELKTGHRVRVPFGPRRVQGWVVGFSSRAPVPHERLREIEAILPEDPLPGELLDLASWISRRYLCLRVQALRLVIPPGVRGKGVRPRVVRMALPARPAPELAQAVGELSRRAPRQAALLELLARSPAGLESAAALKETGAHHGALQALVRRGLVRIEERERRRDPFGGRTVGGDGDGLHTPTADQQRCLDSLDAALAGRRHRAFLLHGVTGSGKTDIYLHTILHCLEGGRTAICLVPEISLTPQLVGRFRSALGADVAVLHSALSAGERFDEWRRLRRGEARVAVGARSAVFAPLENLGLIVMDEEHEPAYKQDEAARYHAREVALERARRAGAVLLCGSATPSLESLERAARGEWTILHLPHRIDRRPLPEVEVVDLRAEYRDGHRSLFSRTLEGALKACVAAGQQAILFLNRRGFATIVLCRECGHAVRCPHCEVSLTLHHAGDRAGVLACHYCEHRQSPPAACPGCGGAGIGYFGAGTERVEQAARQLLPGARIARMDADTTGRKGSHERVYRAFLGGDLDVLIGTQMIAKGWDVPGVTLVGVISADTSLHLPDFRGAERTHQLLVQVAGRAGRGEIPGRVVIQTFNPEHPAVQAACTGDPQAFCDQERDIRRALGYPPFGALIRFTASGPADDAVAAALQEAADRLARDLPAGAELLGPARAPLARLRGRHRWHLIVKGPEGSALREHTAAALLREAGPRGGEVHLAVDVDPVSML